MVSEARDGLRGVLEDAVAAVLLIDVTAGTVTYANRAAVRLAGDVELPAEVDDWSRAAGLRSLDETPLDAGSHPLSRLAVGSPVAGEPVLVRPGEAGGVSDGGHLFWVSGFPLSDNPKLASLALVVLLELDEGRQHSQTLDGPVGQDPMAALRDRAVLATELAFTISDPREPDHPLVWVNDAFTTMTGYRFDEAVGRNCRFLQGWGTDPDAVTAIREALAAERSLTLTLLNYRADGSPFWNELSMSPVYDAQGQLANFVGVQLDVTVRVEAEAERERAYAIERDARRQVEAAHAELELLAAVTTRLTSSLDLDQSLDRLAELLVPGLADWCLVDLVNDKGAPSVAARHGDPARAATVAVMVERYEAGYGKDSARQRVLSTGRPLLVSEISPEDLLRSSDDPEVREAFDRAGSRSAVFVPLVGRRAILGVLTLVRGQSGRVFDERDLAIAVDMGRRAGVCMDNARLYQQEHRTAELLQRSMLPTLPDVTGLTLAARYLVSGVGAQVGGDWYDALSLPDGATGISIGDVMGHDPTAAAAMGQLRGMVRALAWDGERPPLVLDRLDRLVQGLAVAELATVIYARVEPVHDGSGSVLHFANAGHLPPMLLLPSGEVEVVDDHVSPLIGAVPPDGSRRELSVDLPSGTVVALYTDGLVERRDEQIDGGMARLVDALAACAGLDDLELACDRIISTLVEGTLQDDIALLLVRVD